VYVLQVMKFRGWYNESVPETPSEQYRIRFVDIMYFLEDDSMSIVEPKVENSGLLQGYGKKFCISYYDAFNGSLFVIDVMYCCNF